MPKEYYFKEGCFIEEWLNNDMHEDVSIARVRVEPNTTTKLHSLNNITERYAILSGYGEVTVGKSSWSVSTSDVVTIAPGEAQKIKNVAQQDLIFLAICTPRFKESEYIELNEDT